MREQLEELKKKALEEIKGSQSLEFLENLWRQYLGRNGKLRDYSLHLKDLLAEEKAEVGQLINTIKNDLEQAIQEKKNENSQRVVASQNASFDPTLPGAKIERGHLHLYTQMKYLVADIFHSMGFEILEGPELETDYYNFEALNIPKSHPARDMWDTFYLKATTPPQRDVKYLLRTHTSGMQVRVMEKRKPPLRICVIGKCYRHEATDASHEYTLNQIEGFVVDEKISVANLIYILKTFLTNLFGQKVEIRLRPSYFPFTEPSFEVDFACLNCAGKGCAVCGQSGWVEILGCGMIHPQVFASAGYTQGKYTGFAFGVGLDRLVMMRHKINDIRWFNSGDLRFMKQF